MLTTIEPALVKSDFFVLCCLARVSPGVTNGHTLRSMLCWVWTCMHALEHACNMSLLKNPIIWQATVCSLSVLCISLTREEVVSSIS